MKNLVKGDAGFIRSAVIRLAIARGHSVVNLDARTYASLLGNVASVAKLPNHASEQVDILNHTVLGAIFSTHSLPMWRIK